MDNEPAQAIRLCQVFEEWAAKELGPTHPLVAQAVAREAWCEARLGRQRESCDLYRRASSLLEASVGARHPAARRVAAYLATECPEGGEAPAAGHELSPPRRLEGLAPFDPLAHVDLDAEMDRFRAAVRQMGMSELIPEGPPSDSTMFMVGTVLTEIGDVGLAAEAFEQYERWAAGEYGADHDYVLQAVYALAYCQACLGSYAESCRLYERAKQILERTHPGHPEIEVIADWIEACCPPAPGEWFFGIGTRLATEGSFEDAIGAFTAYERWVARDRGPDHRYVAHAVAVQAHCYAQVEQVAVACRLYRRVVGLAESAGLREETMAEVAAYLAEHRRDDGQPDASVAVRLGDTWTPPSINRIEPELGEVGEALINSGHPDEALSALEAYEAWMVREASPDDSSLGPVLAMKGACQAELGNQEEACRLYERARRFYRPEDAFSREIDEYLRENCRA
jgi:tetratricopeptide (TPR) repeat protein